MQIVIEKITSKRSPIISAILRKELDLTTGDMSLLLVYDGNKITIQNPYGLGSIHNSIITF